MVSPIKRIIFIRGLLRGEVHWYPLKEHLNSHPQLLEAHFVELAGCGERNLELSPMDPQKAVDDLRQELRKKNLQPPYQICAISLGGMVALKWAELYPLEITSLVLINSSLQQLSPLNNRIQLKQLFHLFKTHFLNPQHFELELLKITTNSCTRIESFSKVFQTYSEKFPLRRVNFFRQLLLAMKFRLKSPPQVFVLVLSGLQDQLVSPRCSEKLAQFLKAPLISHPMAGHDIPTDAPDWLINILLTDPSLAAKPES